MNHISFFQGTVTQAPSTAEAFFQRYVTAKPCYYALVQPVPGSSLEQPVLCCSQTAFLPGDTVFGIYCCHIDGTPTGICLPKDYCIFLEKDTAIAEAFLEYEAYRYCLFRFSGARNGIWPKVFASGSLLKYAASARKPLLHATVVSMARTDDNRERKTTNRYSANLSLAGPKKYPDSIPTAFTAEIDHPVEKGQNVLFLVYVEPKERSTRLLSIPSLFSDWILSLNSATEYPLLETLLQSELFHLIGILLRKTMSRLPLPQDDPWVRILVTDPKLGTARALSLGRRERMHWTEFPYRHTEAVQPGCLYTAQLLPQGDDFILDSLTPIHWERAEQSFPNDVLDEEADPEDSRAMPLLTVRETEKCLRASPGTEKNHFNSSSFYWAVENGTLNTLHFEVLDWIGFLKYATGQLIARLFWCGYIPRNMNELSEAQKARIHTIRSETKMLSKVLQEGDTARTVSFTLRNSSSNHVKKMADQLVKFGLAETGVFSDGADAVAVARIYLPTEFGCNLLRAQRRSGRNFDTFAYMRDPRHIKQILSGNQLMVAFLETLRETHTIHQKELKIDTYVMTNAPDEKEEHVVARLAFTMAVRKKEDEKQKVIVLAESIRNTTGLSKELDEMSIVEKIPRLLYVANRHTKDTGCPVVLSYVFTTYDEMCRWAQAISEQRKQLADNDDNLHIVYTYDTAILGQGANSFFTFDDASGKPALISDFPAWFAQLC